jgi:excisionase family DNA binding protein
MEIDQRDKRILLKIEDAAILLSMGRAKAYQMAAAGELPGTVRLGRSVRVSREALNDWVRKQVSRSNGPG